MFTSNAHEGMRPVCTTVYAVHQFDAATGQRRLISLISQAQCVNCSVRWGEIEKTTHFDLTATSQRDTFSATMNTVFTATHPCSFYVLLFGTLFSFKLFFFSQNRRPCLSALLWVHSCVYVLCPDIVHVWTWTDSSGSHIGSKVLLSCDLKSLKCLNMDLSNIRSVQYWCSWD